METREIGETGETGETGEKRRAAEPLAKVAGGPAPAPAETTKGAAKAFNLDEIPVGEQRSVSTQEDLNRVLAAHGRWIAGVFDLDQSVPPGRAHLAGMDLRPFDLRHRDLSGAQLAGANFQEMDLTGVSFTAANLSGANLACANLGGAKLRGAKLHGADLRGADLAGVSLVGVDLSHAILVSPPSAPE